MPRWKALPDELDPQIKEFTSQLRGLVDRSGLSIATLADRTGYSKTSWERYLSGWLLAPKGAVVALAEVTGTSPVHLTTMWELAERAWSKAEMRHDRTMEQLRIAQARAALGEFGADEAEQANGAAQPRKGGGATAGTGITGPAGVSPAIPPQPTASAADGRGDADREAASGPNSWALAGYQGPSRASGRPGAGDRPPIPPDGPARPPAALNRYGAQPRVPRAAGPVVAEAPRGRQRPTMLLAALVGALLVAGAAFYVTTQRGGGRHQGAAASPSPSASTAPGPPAGVKCAGAACTGEDAEAMGCTGELVTTAKTATVGTVTLEVRYSKACGAAWGRITGGAQGDRVRVTAGKARTSGDITTPGDTIAYTPMVAVKDVAEATACASLASGQTGCTK